MKDEMDGIVEHAIESGRSFVQPKLDVEITR